MKLTRTDWLFALVVGALLEAAWAVQDWANLRALRLPDTDDMMRLQQIRDWLGGQSWWDLTQHRLGLDDGLAMHWTRVNDLIPAVLITVLKPLLGTYQAELAAVLIGPALLFFAFLILSARAGLALAGEGARADLAKITVLIAALAFPATGMFIPGRIDHHALQIVLVLAAVNGALGMGAWSGAVTGLAMTTSLAVGLETVPQMVAIVSSVALQWAVYETKARGKMAALGAVLIIMPVVFLVTFGTSTGSINNWQLCDGFSFTTLMLFTDIAVALILLGWRIRRGRWQFRIILSFGVIAGVMAQFLYMTPVCRVGPYGAVDPFLKRVWLGNVAEARGLLQQSSVAVVWGYGALIVVALGVLCWFVVSLFPRRRKSSLVPDQVGDDENMQMTMSGQTTKLLIIAAPLAMSLIVMLFQLRGAYIGAGPVAPILGLWLSRLRAGGGVELLTAALLSAGVVHHVAADAVAPWLTRGTKPDAPAPTATASIMGKLSGGAGCTDAVTLHALAALPPTRIMAPIDAGAYIIGATPHHVFAAPYHRNNAGNLAMYRFFLAPPDVARAQARSLQIDYVMLCSDSFAELQDEPGLANSLVAALKSGHAPNWLQPQALKGSWAMLFRVGVQ